MDIRIVAVGKIKQNYAKEGISEFSKRLQRYCNLEVIEVDDERINNNLSQKEMDKIKKTEGERIISALDGRAYTIVLDPNGKPMSSEGLAKSINNLQVQGYSSIEFVIGGALGLHENVKKAADRLLTFSHLTFTHQMIRLILLEQIYRAFKIKNNEPYHL
ncbi:23S rRNA (pseudouridine(1915)-N(3))-methyltransferase RlmH [Halanaerobacter jeridensis]|uniref:Ribosomal RNA large subunit methyltransferase H n=1 Tax=Halanaerobacter jeridensis TaxID=706427 RepID=A0A939BMV1_9FIRM|nr:23S rRNA (pseudouridine(1915)-N(3))-methyltransferase RlmH [Halanaerobacter jeridensis]MBM7557570.1 23S rRNA (pseudouridine1915-N3)-methyltransferase [Halanaerobacter jeridensis]